MPATNIAIGPRRRSRSCGNLFSIKLSVPGDERSGRARPRYSKIGTSLSQGGVPWKDGICLGPVGRFSRIVRNTTRGGFWNWNGTIMWAVRAGSQKIIIVSRFKRGEGGANNRGAKASIRHPLSCFCQSSCYTILISRQPVKGQVGDNYSVLLKKISLSL